jgi:hypothetical protein
MTAAGNKFRKALKLLSMSQVEFANLFGIAPRTVRNYVDDGVSNSPTRILINLMLLGKLSRQDIDNAREKRHA